jgi:glycine betaine/choline ABC-type transport system substrate-binding protein
MRKHTALATLVCCCLLPIACGGEDEGSEPQVPSGPIRAQPGAETTEIVIGSTRAVERRLLAEVYVLALRAAGYRVDTDFTLRDPATGRRALSRGAVDGFPEATETALEKLAGEPADDVPRSERRAYELLRRRLEPRELVAAPPAPFPTALGVAMRAVTARRLRVRTLSGLAAKRRRLRASAPARCACRRPLERAYGFDFRRFAVLRPDLRHELLRKRLVDVAVAGAMDPQLVRNDLVLLSDDRHAFGATAFTLLLRRATLRGAAEEVEEVIAQAGAGLSPAVMQELLARVELDERSPQRVAAGYLRRSGLVE